MFRKKLTEVAVDSVTQYLQERFERLKEFDLDEDGVKDVDQVIETLERVGVKAKLVIDATNFSELASGLEMFLRGAGMMRAAVHREALTELAVELHAASKVLSNLGQLTIQYVKEHPPQS